MLNSVDLMDFVNSVCNTDTFRSGSVGILESVDTMVILKNVYITWTWTL